MSNDLITADLQLLAAASQHPRAVALAPLRGHQPVAAITSLELVRRSVEFAAVTHAWRPVFAHRVARAVAGAFAAVVALISWTSFVHDPASAIEPAYNIGGTVLLLGAVYGLAYRSGGRRYDRGLGGRGGRSELLAAARARVQRLDGVATFLAMVGLVAVLPVLAYYVCGANDLVLSPSAPPPGAVVFGDFLEITTLGPLLKAAVIGVAVHRARHGVVSLPGWVRVLESCWVGVIGVGLGALAARLATLALAEHATAGPHGDALLIALVTQLGIMLVSAWLPLWLRRREAERVIAAAST